jgi:hypothetical protein
MPITDAELKAIVAMTSRFETGGAGYAGISGDFDGMGISCGVLQWNIGSHSLQPLVQAVGEAEVRARMPRLGAAMWTACTGPTRDGLAIVRGWQTGTRLSALARGELLALMTAPAMRAQQDQRIRAVARDAEALADDWARARGGPGRTLREVAFFFDLVTQNGGPGGITHAQVAAFRARAQPGRADDLICDYLASAPQIAGWKDARENARLWRDPADAAGLDLLIFAYLRSALSKKEWRLDVLNRKGAIAMRRGWVHRGLVDFGGAF